MTPKYTCVRIYVISCMPSGGDDNLDSIFGRPVSYELVAMMESPQLTSRLLAEPLRRRTGSQERCWLTQRSCHPAIAGRSNCGEEVLGLVYLSLTRSSPFPHPCIISHVLNAGILVTPEKIYTREN